ncbi:MAG: hypothetical protein M3527_04755 [Actinomycetota bacterium]|nr:hypothetical protein [Acidimicrobiia bacterium]MDQ3293745.1 hypothetical protein [Actinomycetota bacterium]
MTETGPKAVHIGIDPFGSRHDPSFDADDDSQLARECELVEDGGELRAHDPVAAGARPSLAFVDGSVRTDMRLTRTTEDGTTTGIVGSYVAGAVHVPGDGRRARVDPIVRHRVVLFTHGHLVHLPPQPGGWAWESHATECTESFKAAQRVRTLMRESEVQIAEALSEEGILTILDGPLSMVRSGWSKPIVGYVKSHPVPMLERSQWVRVPTIAVGQRTSVFAINGNLYATYLRLGDAGPGASPWGGIARLEVPAGVGREAAIAALDEAASWLPRFASSPHRDARAPVNLVPVGGLEWRLRHEFDDSRLAMRAVTAAVLQLGQQAA